jgi:hypothetical protein
VQLCDGFLAVAYLVLRGVNLQYNAVGVGSWCWAEHAQLEQEPGTGCVEKLRKKMSSRVIGVTSVATFPSVYSRLMTWQDLPSLPQLNVSTGRNISTITGAYSTTHLPPGPPAELPLRSSLEDGSVVDAGSTQAATSAAH